jgi:hypothetical protein
LMREWQHLGSREENWYGVLFYALGIKQLEIN